MKLTIITTAVLLTASIALAAPIEGIRGDSTPRNARPSVIYLTSSDAW